MGKDTKKDKDESGHKDKGARKRERLVVVAALDFGTETPQEVMDALLPLVDATRDEEGCRKYKVHVPAEGSGRLLFYEVWEDEAAFKAHLESDHLKAFRAAVGHVLKDSLITTWRRMG